MSTCSLTVRPGDSFSTALQTSFAQQVLFEGKMKSLEERLGSQMERLITSLTFTYQKQFEILSDRMNVALYCVYQIDRGRYCRKSCRESQGPGRTAATNQIAIICFLTNTPF